MPKVRDAFPAMSRVAFLVYAPEVQRRADNSFDGNGNFGACVIADALRRAGIETGFVTPESAHVDADVVLISLTSTYDIYALLRAVALRPEWKLGPRHFRVLAGGFGVQNPTAIREYVDYCAFGRAHEWVAEIVNSIAHDHTPKHPSLMDMREMNPVAMHQGALYPHEVNGNTEKFTGCPRPKCAFCHYTFARRYHAVKDCLAYEDGRYFQNTLSQTPEVTWNQLLTWPKKAGRIRVAIDGFSERLRYTYGKCISNQEIIAGIEQVGSHGGTTTLLVYNVVNFPGETEGDYNEFIATVGAAQPSGRVIFVVQSSPFRPSLLTPMQWEPASLTPDWSKRREQVILERRNLRVVHSFTLESAWRHLKSIIAERAIPEDDRAVQAILFSPKLRAGCAEGALALFARNFDLAQWIGERDINGSPPFPHLSSYVPLAGLRKMAHRLRRLRWAWTAESGQGSNQEMAAA